MGKKEMIQEYLSEQEKLRELEQRKNRTSRLCDPRLGGCGWEGSPEETVYLSGGEHWTEWSGRYCPRCWKDGKGRMKEVREVPPPPLREEISRLERELYQLKARIKEELRPKLVEFFSSTEDLTVRFYQGRWEHYREVDWDKWEWVPISPQEAEEILLEEYFKKVILEEERKKLPRSFREAIFGR